MTLGPVETTDAEHARDLVDVLRDLAGLRDDGLLTEAEFQRARALAVPHGTGAGTSQEGPDR